MEATLLFGAIFVIWSAYVIWANRRNLAKYRARNHASELWKSRFPSASQADLLRFIYCFGEGFGLPKSLWQKFQPDDQIYEIYRFLYGGKTPLADAMEFELFMELLSKEFPVSIHQILSCLHAKVTLEECFALTQLKPQ